MPVAVATNMQLHAFTVKEGNAAEDNKGCRNAPLKFYLYIEIKEVHMVPCMWCETPNKDGTRRRRRVLFAVLGTDLADVSVFSFLHKKTTLIECQPWVFGLELLMVQENVNSAYKTTQWLNSGLITNSNYNLWAN